MRNLLEFIKDIIEGIAREGFDWLRRLKKISFLALIALLIYFAYPYAKSVIYHAKNRGDVEFRLLALEERCDHFRNKVSELKRRIEKLE
ncbi:hypothetical protein K8R61_01060 [bacterium]|nr:hypothetical protein [bacterium]